MTKTCNVYKGKAELFNTFFQKKWSKIDSGSKLLSDLVCFTNDNCLIMNSIEFNKAHGHDMINIRILKICDESICKPFPPGNYMIKVKNRNTRKDEKYVQS